VLNFDCTCDGLNDARELDEKTIAGRLNDATVVLRDFGIDEFASMRPQPIESSRLVLAHQEAITDDISGENSRESAFDPLSAQMYFPRLEGTG